MKSNLRWIMDIYIKDILILDTEKYTKTLGRQMFLETDTKSTDSKVAGDK